MQSEQAARYRAIVERFDTIARASLETEAQVADLCAGMDVSQRTVARAFRAIRGTTPVRYLQALRLNEARRVLMAQHAPGSVTEVATRFGFRELGRFAGEYRATFGESPSETLRRQCRASEKRCGIERN